LLYGPDGEVVAWGFEAMAKYASLRQKQQDQGYHFLKNFKMALYEKEGKVWDNQRLIFKNGQRVLLKENRENNQKIEFVVADLVADYLNCMKEFALAKLHHETSGLIEEKQVLWCLTVPAIWGYEEKQLMRQAAIHAGLISNTSEDKERLVVVLEPEAAAVLCAEKDAMLKVSELKNGSCFMIIDAGGGTIDITVHEVVSNKGQNSLEEAVPGLGGPYGSTYIDDRFVEYIISKLGIDVMQDIYDKEPVAYREMMSQWEERKCRFTGGEEDNATFVYLNKLYRFLSDNYPEVLQSLAEVQDGNDDAFILSNDVMHELFCPVIDGVETLVEKQFERLGPRLCDFIFLVGGFSTSPLLQKRIYDNFNQRVLKIVIPGEPGAAIELGAVSLGLDPAVVRARRARLTYGMDSSQKFIPGIDPLGKRDTAGEPI
jgi:molecular chaperone DnaK (HSP70)